MSKYQKALDELKNSKLKFATFDGQKENDEAPRIFDLYHHEIFILQELVDTYTEDSDYRAEIIHDKNERIKELEDRLVEQESINKEALKEMAECIERYQMKLYEACVELCLKNKQLHELDNRYVLYDEEQWKEWILRDD